MKKTIFILCLFCSLGNVFAVQYLNIVGNNWITGLTRFNYKLYRNGEFYTSDYITPSANEYHSVLMGYEYECIGDFDYEGQTYHFSEFKIITSTYQTISIDFASLVAPPPETNVVDRFQVEISNPGDTALNFDLALYDFEGNLIGTLEDFITAESGYNVVDFNVPVGEYDWDSWGLVSSDGFPLDGNPMDYVGKIDYLGQIETITQEGVEDSVSYDSAASPSGSSSPTSGNITDLASGNFEVVSAINSASKALSSRLDTLDNSINNQSSFDDSAIISAINNSSSKSVVESFENTVESALTVTESSMEQVTDPVLDDFEGEGDSMVEAYINASDTFKDSVSFFTPPSLPTSINKSYFVGTFELPVFGSVTIDLNPFSDQIDVIRGALRYVLIIFFAWQLIVIVRWGIA